MRQLLFLTCSATLGIAGCAAPSGGTADLRLINGKTRTIAHRGGTGPDGTISACLRSLELGVEFLELDVRLTSDAEPVILHDPTVDRTTNGSGRVDQMTLKELKQLDAGVKYRDPEDSSRSYAGERVPTVREVLRAVGSRAVVLLELKVPEAAGPVAYAIRKEEAAERAVIRTADESVLGELRDREPTILTGTMASLPSPNGIDAFVARLSTLGVSALTPRQNSKVTSKMVSSLRARGIAVWGTNTNDLDEMRRLIELGVDGVITDRPSTLLSLMGK